MRSLSMQANHACKGHAMFSCSMTWLLGCHSAYYALDIFLWHSSTSGVQSTPQPSLSSLFRSLQQLETA
jgi:hypothetical protein